MRRSRRPVRSAAAPLAIGLATVLAAPALALAQDATIPAVADVAAMRWDPAGNHGDAAVLAVKNAVPG